MGKIRATIQEPGVAQLRYIVMKDCLSRYNIAMNHNFFLEATALIESLIADRLESRLTELQNKPYHFDTIGNLRRDLSKIETDPNIISIINQDINSWVCNRNKVIHRAAKIEQGELKVFSEFLDNARTTASDGYEIFRKLDKELKRLRK